MRATPPAIDVSAAVRGQMRPMRGHKRGCICRIISKRDFFKENCMAGNTKSSPTTTLVKPLDVGLNSINGHYSLSQTLVVCRRGQVV